MFTLIDYKYKDLFQKSHVDKQLKIVTDDGSFTATNSDIHFEDFELVESLCSDSELKFGSCEASMVKFQVKNAFIPLAGKWLTITEYLDGNTDVPFKYGRYKVFSDKPTADHEYRDIVAYDAMYDILGADVKSWYDGMFSSSSNVTLKVFRESFADYFNLDAILPEGGLINDGIKITKTIEKDQISGKDIITAICEINGCFGHIGRDGKLHYIYLEPNIQGLYPANDLYPDHAPYYLAAQKQTGHLYPQSPKSSRVGKDRYIECQYEDYIVNSISKVKILKEENQDGGTYGGGDNCYTIEGNPFACKRTAEELNGIAQRIFEKITNVTYRPFSADCQGNPCMEVGDPVRLLTKYEIVETYILRRTLKGIQSLKDTYSSTGSEKRIEKLNSVQKQISNLNSATATLDRNIGETNVNMKEMDERLSSEITVTSAQIRAELKNTADGLSNTITITAGEIRAELANEVNGLNSRITITAGEIRTELKNTKDGLESSISQTASEIRSEVRTADNALASSISQTASQIRSEVSSADANLQSQITQNAGEIDLRVTKAGVVSAINMSPESVTITASKIDLNGLVNADQLVSKFAQIKTVKAEYMEVANWTSAGYIKADRIDANTIAAKIQTLESTLIVPRINCTQFLLASNATINSLSVGSITGTHWQNITVDDTTYTVLCK